MRRGLEPTHPGIILKDLYLKPLRLSQMKVAEHLQVTRKTLNLLLNGRQAISAEMALRLAKALRTSNEFWMNLQMHYDLWHAQKNTDLSQVKPIKKRPSRYASEEAA